MRALALLVMVGVSGCTLLLDVDSVRRHRDAGPPVDQDAGPTFVKDVCGNTAPLACLSFAPPAGNFGVSNVAAIDGGFLAVVERKVPHQVELYTVGFDGFSAPLKTWPLVTGGLNTIALSTAGDAWAVAWVQPPFGQHTATAVGCVSGTSLASFPATPTTATCGTVNYATAAVNQAGDVALAASDEYSFTYTDEPMRAAVGTAGCPVSLQDTDGGWAAVGVGTVAMADGGFWFTSNAYSVVVYRQINGTITDVSSWSPTAWPDWAQTTVLSSDATRLISLVGYDTDDGGVGLYFKPFRINQDPPLNNINGTSIFESFQPAQTWTPVSWSAGNCGDGCLVTAMVPADSTAPNIVLAFTDDSANFHGLGATYYTAACAKSPQVWSVHTAWSLGLVGTMYSDPSHANFYLCQKPTY